jgi:hypothetical protein
MQPNNVRRRRGAGVVLVLPIIIASAEFSNIARNPRFEQIHNVDIVGLMACGFCLGVAFTGLMFIIRGKSGNR